VRHPAPGNLAAAPAGLPAAAPAGRSAAHERRAVAAHAARPGGSLCSVLLGDSHAAAPHRALDGAPVLQCGPKEERLNC